MEKILIKNGILVDPESKTTEKADLLIEDGRIAHIAVLSEARPERQESPEDGQIAQIAGLPEETADLVLDADGCYVMPGLIDLHVHLRDPGLEYKETVETGAAAALKGGVTTMVAMPNTKPPADRADIIRYVQNKAADTTACHVIQAGCLTRQMAGRELSDLEGMIAAGCRVFSEDGKSVMNSLLCRQAMKLLAENDCIVLAHCEDIDLVNGGVMNDDTRAKELGLPGISNAVEDIIAARDIILAKETGVHLHLCHCSTKDSVTMVKLAKEAGVSVSAEVCPHHFSLCTEDIPGDDANYKMNPPLRTREDMEALREGLKADIMEVISTDHAPHSAEEKAQSFLKAPFGITGLETSAALTYTTLVKPGILSILQMAEKMSYHPAQILKLSDRGVIREGAAADLMIFDPRREWIVDPEQFVSKGHNTPFAGKKLCGEVKVTLVDGKVVYRAEGY